MPGCTEAPCDGVGGGGSVVCGGAGGCDGRWWGGEYASFGLAVEEEEEKEYASLVSVCSKFQLPLWKCWPEFNKGDKCSVY